MRWNLDLWLLNLGQDIVDEFRARTGIGWVTTVLSLSLVDAVIDAVDIAYSSYYGAPVNPTLVGGIFIQLAFTPFNYLILKHTVSARDWALFTRSLLAFVFRVLIVGLSAASLVDGTLFEVYSLWSLGYVSTIVGVISFYCLMSVDDPDGVDRRKRRLEEEAAERHGVTSA
jgi:hypothetical protein